LPAAGSYFYPADEPRQTARRPLIHGRISPAAKLPPGSALPEVDAALDLGLRVGGAGRLEFVGGGRIEPGWLRRLLGRRRRHFFYPL